MDPGQGKVTFKRDKTVNIKRRRNRRGSYISQSEVNGMIPICALNCNSQGQTENYEH